MSEVEGIIGYTFKDKDLLHRALTLSSADSENNNQTLEFFGDAIIEFIISERLFSSGEDEGELTRKRSNFVSDENLASVSKGLGLDKYLIRSSGDNNNKKAVPSVYEAVAAAIYLDGGMDAARAFVNSTLTFGAEQTRNFKGELQELLQSKGEGLPAYVKKTVGSLQSPRHFAEVSVFGQTFCAEAETVKKAEQLAARKALEYINHNF